MKESKKNLGKEFSYIVFYRPENGSRGKIQALGRFKNELDAFTYCYCVSGKIKDSPCYFVFDTLKGERIEFTSRKTNFRTNKTPA